MKRFLTLILATMVIASCDDILDTEPRNEITNETALEDFQGVRGVLIGAYDQFQNTGQYGRDLIVIPELLADNMRIALQNTNRLTGVAVNAERANIANWNDTYDIANRVNTVIEAIDGVPDATQEEIDDTKGQALFLRALAYHNLVKVYARNPNHLNGVVDGVPLVLKPFSGIDESSFPERTPVAEVYDQIEADLAQAISLLSDDGNPSYATRTAAQALLARVFLYRGKWGEAADMANTAIANSGLALNPAGSYLEIFRQGSESIFQIEFRQGESLGPNNALAAFYVTSGDAVMRQDMLNQFDAADDRFENGVMTLTQVQGPEVVTKTLKFNSYGGSQGIDNVPVLRLSELYLIRAEANLEAGSSIGASPLDDVNAIRTRAGLVALGSVTVDDILNERRLELAFEGHRWFDLKRRGLDIPKGVNGIDCSAECSIDNADYRVVQAISQQELDINPNLEQNPGYN